MKQRIRCLTISLLTSSALMAGGCSSIMTRVGPNQGYYSGAKNDVKMIKHEDTGWAMTPLLALDLPLSAVVDTLLLPYDYYRSDSNPEDESPRARVLRNEQTSGVNNVAPSH